MKGPFGEKIIFSKNLNLEKKSQLFFFVDEKLKEKLPSFETKSICFLKSGEDLKSIEQLIKNINFLNQRQCSRNDILVAIGGGTVTDSIGFLSSVYLRGLKFICVPTTWLSAVDAGVGGKTALNFKGYKNQIGTVWPAYEIHYCSSLIGKSTKPDSKGEVLKTLILNHKKKWANELLKNFSIDNIEFEDLKKFIKYKSQIVKNDPYDKKGIRAVLNFGHTLGHAFELNLKLSHGEAVCYGLSFAIEWSRHLGFLSDSKAFELTAHLPTLNAINLEPKLIEAALLKDKKRDKNHLNFVFLENSSPIVKNKKIESVVDEYKRQKNI